ncbi:hypothetical protein [Moorena sp. SIO3H5]|uniref:hypothetical protein n=1 Tax=Moorena sp. SIO3H5 TaxID=2607834 RepID=UPI0013BE5883|nr:hypothetical protein [Moorena sp. SIO3H5]NEO72477.1 hypothetical protein [Moorena sp. SIO3H5]
MPVPRKMPIPQMPILPHSSNHSIIKQCPLLPTPYSLLPTPSRINYAISPKGYATRSRIRLPPLPHS